MSQPDDGSFECDETHVRFTWPTWQVYETGSDKLSINAEMEHGAFIVMFEVTARDVMDAQDRTLCEFGLTIDSLERLVRIARAQEDRR
jgi:hypothetical protein